MVSLGAASLIQIRDWKRMFDYTVVEMKRAVLHTYLKDNVPKPLSLTTCAEMKDEDLSVGNTVYIVHYPKISETYDRHENAEQISIIQGISHANVWHSYISTLAPQHLTRRDSPSLILYCYRPLHRTHG